MNQAKNILFIMCDQLRWDYLSCYGHPHLHTPNIDWLAENGVRFDKAFVQSPVCGPSRACFYTGRYQTTLGVRHNGFPLRIDELGMGDYLRQAGMNTAIAGKSDLSFDSAAAQRLAIDMNAPLRKLRGEFGFKPFDRDSGVHPLPRFRQRGEWFQYNAYLRSQGYDGENPWQTYANSTIDEQGNIVSGWFNHHVKYPANIQEEHSETAYMTNRAIDFMRSAGESPWCLHLSYIKPHWPYVAPAPYHNTYAANHILPANRTKQEQAQPPHPVQAAFMRYYCADEGFKSDEIRETVIPVYMGLIKQIDDHLGRLFAWMREQGLMENSMIVFTSDHGDYLGDHWMTDKYWFHEEVVRAPLIIYDPSDYADATRGTVCPELVESIDLIPTFVEFAGSQPDPERLEGHSLMPIIRGEMPASWRKFVICQEDYSMLTVRHHLNLPIDNARATMLRTNRWKFILHEAFPPELYDLEKDPTERHNLGNDPAYESIRRELNEQLFRWFRNRKLQITKSRQYILKRSQPGWIEEQGVFIGYWRPPPESPD